jgi:Methyltransferase domain
MKSRIEEYTKRCEAALEAALIEKTKLTDSELSLTGMSSTKNRILMNELVKKGDRYLEIGVYRGSTFVAAMYKNKPDYAVAIDNFSEFTDLINREQSNEVIKKLASDAMLLNPNDASLDNESMFKKALADRNITNYTLLNTNCFNVPPLLESHLLDQNFNVYLYDGGHTYEDHKKALTYYYNTLANEFIFIVDDWNWEPARRGTFDAMGELGIKLHRDFALLTNFNGDTASWWNGFYIAVCEKTK